MNKYNRIIVFVSIIASFFMFFVAKWGIEGTQKKFSDGYYHFASIISEDIASDYLKFKNDNTDFSHLKTKLKNLVNNSDDLSYVFLISKENKKIITEGEKSDAQIKLSYPLEGVTVELGLSGKSLKESFKATKKSIIAIFAVAWIIALAAILATTSIITRQIKILADGVEKISSGEFGYKLNTKDLWGELKKLFDNFNDMSLRLRGYEEQNIIQLTHERDKLTSVLMGISSGVVVCDDSDTIAIINNSAREMLDFTEKNPLNTNIISYRDEKKILVFKDCIEKFKTIPLIELKAKASKFRLNVNDKILTAAISPMFSLNQNYLGYIIVLHDITKQAETDKLKEQFISNVSHELRTPVTVIRSYADTLHNYADKFGEAEKAEFAEIINNESERLNHMVNDILDFSRIEADIKLEKHPVNIETIIELVANSMSVIAREKRIKISISKASDIPVLDINADSIERALKNLVSNAIKYSTEGSVVKIKTSVIEETVRVEVEDEGLGIEKRHLAKIFDRFYRVENKVHTVKGTGLGLHLVKLAIEKHHNGKVFVTSTPAKGSTFGFILPLKS